LTIFIRRFPPRCGGDDAPGFGAAQAFGIPRRLGALYIFAMAVAFDTLKLARRLEAAGFSTAQAQGAAEALADTLTAGLATQADLAALRSELREGDAALQAEIAALRSEVREGDGALRAEIAALRSELREGDATLRAEMREGDATLRAEMREMELRLRADMSEVRADMASLRAELVKWVVGVGIAIGGAILSATLTLLHLLPHG
jgi:hypothetical protein